MSLVKDAILSLAREGEITHEFEVKGIKFVLRTLKTEEQMLADGMVEAAKLREKYGAKDLIILSDTIQKYRTIAMVALSTKTINGQSPVDTNESLEVQFKQRQELRDELMELGTTFVEILIREYTELTRKEAEFYSDVESNVGKS